MTIQEIKYPTRLDYDDLPVCDLHLSLALPIVAISMLVFKARARSSSFAHELGCPGI